MKRIAVMVFVGVFFFYGLAFSAPVFNWTYMFTQNWGGPDVPEDRTPGWFLDMGVNVIDDAGYEITGVKAFGNPDYELSGPDDFGTGGFFYYVFEEYIGQSGSWEIVATNSNGESASTYTPTLNSPRMVPLVSNVKFEGEKETPTIFWDSVDSVDNYRVRITTNGSYGIYSSPSFNDTSFTVPDGIIDPDQEYIFRIQAVDYNDDGENWDRSDYFVSYGGGETIPLGDSSNFWYEWRCEVPDNCPVEGSVIDFSDDKITISYLNDTDKEVDFFIGPTANTCPNFSKDENFKISISFENLDVGGFGENLEYGEFTLYLPNMGIEAWPNGYRTFPFPGLDYDQYNNPKNGKFIAEKINDQIILTIEENGNSGSATYPVPENWPEEANFEIKVGPGNGLGISVDITRIEIERSGNGTPPDSDGDGVEDDQDNCPEAYNSDQTDFDGDEIGDVCDSDVDGDGVVNEWDTCPDTPLDSYVDPTGCPLTNYYTQEEYNAVLTIISQKEDEIDELNGIIGDLNASLDSLEQANAALQAIVAERDQTIADLNALLAQKNQLISDLLDTVADKDAIIAGLNDTIVAKDQTISDLNASIANLNAIIDSMFTQDQVDQIIEEACPGNSEGQGNSQNEIHQNKDKNGKK
jgi:uncharacterized coiled-coil protein SlyX